MNATNALASANPSAAAAMEQHIEAIRRVTVDDRFAYEIDGLLDDKLGFMAENCKRVLDIGTSTRSRISLFDSEQIETMDINADEPPPDIIDDICAPSRLEYDCYDGIVCLSVLEHVYDPFAAIKEIHRLLPSCR